MIQVTKILSGTVLEDPRSRQARLALRQLSDFDRREQLCNLEAMEQVEAWNDDYKPEVKSEMCWIICLDAAPPRWVSRGRFVPRILRSVRL